MHKINSKRDSIVNGYFLGFYIYLEKIEYIDKNIFFSEKQLHTYLNIINVIFYLKLNISLKLKAKKLLNHTYKRGLNAGCIIKSNNEKTLRSFSHILTKDFINNFLKTT